MADMFSTITNTFAQVESQLHHYTKNLRYKLAPPTYCYVDKDGVTRLKGDQTPYERSPVVRTKKTLFQNEQTPVARTRKNCVATAERDMTTPPITNLDLSCSATGTGTHHPPSMQQDVELTMSTGTDLDIDDNGDEEAVNCNCNLTGKYKLVHNHNYDQFLKSQNVPMLLRKAACASRPVHTITHTDDSLRIQVDGITKGDTTFTINGPPSHSNIRHLKFDDFVTYIEHGRAIEVRKVGKNTPANGAVELIIARRLAECGNNLLISSKARFKDGSYSVESVQTYHRME